MVYLQNGLQLNLDKLEALIIGTASQLRTANSAITSVCVADVELPVANEIKVLGVVLDRHLAFDKHVLAVTTDMQFSCTSHPQYTPLIVDRSGTDIGLQSDPAETGLLQLATLQQHPEVAACEETVQPESSSSHRGGPMPNC